MRLVRPTSADTQVKNSKKIQKRHREKGKWKEAKAKMKNKIY